jgi:isocitrate dehydrogenase
VAVLARILTARASFNAALQRGPSLYVSTKNMIRKAHDG